MKWEEEYRQKLVSAEKAASIIQPGDRVVIPLTQQPMALPAALAARREELRKVEILTCAPAGDPGWYQPGWEESFSPIILGYVGETARSALDEKRIDYCPYLFSTGYKTYDERAKEEKPIDVFMTVVSPPDNNGFCSFGLTLWHKKGFCNRAKKVVAEVDENQIRTYGDNFIHVSEIDYFVEHTAPIMEDEEVEKITAGIEPEERRKLIKQLLFLQEPRLRAANWIRYKDAPTERLHGFPRLLGLGDPDEATKAIAVYVSELIRDGDTLQIGVRAPASFFPLLGVFDDKNDLGIHSELASRGLIKLIEAGVFNGKNKTIHKGKALFTSILGSFIEEQEFARENPKIELYDASYIVNINTVSAHDNFVSMNNALSVDLTGQINSESVLGSRIWNGPGGQPEMHMGAVLSKGGRAITLLQSTALNGAVSRIVAQHDEGSVVTIPRYFADYVVTEYGIARLMGKPLRRRAEELIAIAHPDFRPDLKKAAKKLFYQ